MQSIYPFTQSYLLSLYYIHCSIVFWTFWTAQAWAYLKGTDSFGQYSCWGERPLYSGGDLIPRLVTGYRPPGLLLGLTLALRVISISPGCLAFLALSPARRPPYPGGDLIPRLVTGYRPPGLLLGLTLALRAISLSPGCLAFLERVSCRGGRPPYPQGDLIPRLVT